MHEPIGGLKCAVNLGRDVLCRPVVWHESTKAIVIVCAVSFVLPESSCKKQFVKLSDRFLEDVLSGLLVSDGSEHFETPCTYCRENRNKTDLQGSGLDYGGGEHQRDLRTHYEQLDLNLNPLQAVF